MIPFASGPDISSDVAFAAFLVTFQRRKTDDWNYHREQVARLRVLYKTWPGPNFARGLRQWSESFAELVTRN